MNLRTTFFPIAFLATQTAFPSGDQIFTLLKEIESNLAPKNSKALYQFTNYRNDGTVSKYEVEFVSADIDRSHGTFHKPVREKGREILRLEDVLWTYMPSVGRAVRIADRDSFAGGDFSNADILRVDWTSKYRHKLLKETSSQWIIQLEAKGKDAPYAQMRLWVGKKDRQPVQQNFYDSKGTLLKQLRYGSVRNFGKVSRPARLVMKNVITKQKSELKVLWLKTGEKIPARRFVVDNLGK